MIVVGLPRSGSSFLAHLMSQMGDYYIFDDLYVTQQARAIKAKGPLTPEQFAVLLNYLCWQIRARIRFEENYFKPQATWDDVDRMEESLKQTYAEIPVTWDELTEEVLTRLARYHGRSQWGYKCPGDFQVMEDLRKTFPDVRFVAIMRDLRKVCSSKKFVPKQDGEAGEYHVLAYAIYWRMAYRKIMAFRDGGTAPIHMIRFEDLTSSTEDELARLAAYLDTEVKREVQTQTVNTSFKGKQRREITPTERWICHRVAAAELAEAGYPVDAGRFRFVDLPHLAVQSAVFAMMHARRWVRKPRSRASVVDFLRNLIPRGKVKDDAIANSAKNDPAPEPSHNPT